jgi:hypothetical protein
MDVRVKPAGEAKAWDLRDLLGRSMGTIVEEEAGSFMIRPSGQAVETMRDIRRGPHLSLDAALAEIERHTRGVCRRDEADGPGTAP